MATDQHARVIVIQGRKGRKNLQPVFAWRRESITWNESIAIAVLFFLAAVMIQASDMALMKSLIASSSSRADVKTDSSILYNVTFPADYSFVVCLAIFSVVLFLFWLFTDRENFFSHALFQHLLSEVKTTEE